MRYRKRNGRGKERGREKNNVTGEGEVRGEKGREGMGKKGAQE